MAPDSSAAAENTMVIGCEQPDPRTWQERNQQRAMPPPVYETVEVPVPKGLAGRLPAGMRTMSLSADPAALRDDLCFAFSVGGWRALQDLYRSLAAGPRYSLTNLAAATIQSLVDELMPVMADIEREAREDIGSLLTATSDSLEADTPQLLADTSFDVVKQGVAREWKLAGTSLVTDLMSALSRARKDLAELQDAVGSAGYIDSLTSAPGSPMETATQNAHVRLANAHLAVARALGPVATEHPLVLRLLSLVPGKNAENAATIAKIIAQIGAAVDTVRDELSHRTNWPTSGAETATQFAYDPWSPQVRDPLSAGALTDSPFVRAVRGNPRGPWAYPLVIERVMQRRHILPQHIAYAAAHEVMEGTYDDGAGEFLVLGTVMALDVAFPPAGLVANVMLAAWPLFVDWIKYDAADAGSLASLDAARPIALPPSLRKIAGDALNLAATVVPGWKGLALAGASVVMTAGAAD